MRGTAAPARSLRSAAARRRRAPHGAARSRRSPPSAFSPRWPAVAGAVAETILAAMTQAADLERAYVNNGGDIALHLSDDAEFAVGMVARPDQPSLFGTARVTARDAARGIATSGWRGRSFSSGHRRRRHGDRPHGRRGRRGGDAHRQRRRSARPSRRSRAPRRARAIRRAISAKGSSRSPSAICGPARSPRRWNAGDARGPALARARPDRGRRAEPRRRFPRRRRRPVAKEPVYALG